jgi:hypothetical protein
MRMESISLLLVGLILAVSLQPIFAETQELRKTWLEPRTDNGYDDISALQGDHIVLHAILLASKKGGGSERLYWRYVNFRVYHLYDRSYPLRGV